MGAGIKLMKPAVAFALLLAVFLGAFRGVVPADRFYYDEADYLYAASLGLTANYWDAGVISLTLFVQKGVSEGLDPEKRRSLSEFIRKQQDISFYRHFHGPLYFYWLALLRPWLATERAVRWATLGFILATAMVVYFGGISLTGGQDWRAWTVPAALVLFSPTLINSGVQVTPHNLFVLLSFINLWLLVKFLDSGQRSYWYLAVGFLALSWLTIEYALVNLGVMVLALVWQRHFLFPGGTLREWPGFLLKSLAWFLVVIGLLWPGGILKLTILKNYLFHFYYVAVREYAANSFGHLWWSRFWESPLQFIFIAVFLGYYVRACILKKQKWRPLLPLLLYSAVIFLYTLKNRSLNQTYIASLLPPLLLVSGLGFVSWLKTTGAGKLWQNFMVVGFCLAIIINLFIFYPISNEAERRRINNAVVDYFQTQVIPNRPLLIYWKYLPTFNFYFGKIAVIRYENDDSLPPLLERGGYAGILYEGNSRIFLEKLTERHISWREHNLGSLGEDRVSVIWLREGEGQQASTWSSSQPALGHSPKHPGPSGGGWQTSW